MVNPQFPLYIPSKGRYEKRLTSDKLSEMKVPHYIIVEEQEFNLYHNETKDNPYVTLLILDKKYQDEYETFDKLGNKKSKGPGPARNFAWEHSIKQGHKWHWVMDDNIMRFVRWHKNRQIQVSDGSIFRAMEDFCLRYKNIGMAGPHYYMFAPRREKRPPFITNTRVYSCNLIRNDTQFRWRGRYNEDTDLSLQMLKNGWCTIQFYAFLQDKLTTQNMGGGNTKEFYGHEGTLPKSKMIVAMHPDVCRIMHRYGRWHHYCDYTRFKKLRLKKKENITIPKKPNNYDMKLHEVKK